jgi:hypothetical protein
MDSKLIVLVLTIALASCGLASCGTITESKGNTIVNAAFPAVITITQTPSDTVDLKSVHTTIEPGDTATATNTLNIKSNTPWTLSAKASTDHMMSGTDALSAKLQITKSDGTTVKDVDMAGTGNLYSGYQPVNLPDGVDFAGNYKQVFGTGDPAGAYTISIEWTVSGTV